jgi:ABC-type branched-subunit amino acid transport system substrate-binding protein
MTSLNLVTTKFRRNTTMAKRISTGLGIAVVGALLAGAACSSEDDATTDSAADQPRTIKIGAVVPLEGQSASLGKSFLEAVRVSLDTLGDTTNEYKLVVEDGGTTPEESTAAAKRLVEEDGVDAIVGGISIVGQYVAPVATEAKIPMLCVCSIPTIGDGEYNFTNIPLAEDEADAWVAEAQRQGIKSVAIIAQQYPSIDGHVNALKSAAGAAGIEVVYEYRFPQGTTSFLDPVRTALEQYQPDAFYVSGYEPSLSAVGKQLQLAEQMVGTKLNVTSIVAIGGSDDMSIFEGDWYTDSDLATPEVMAQFRNAYPSSTFITHMMPYAYDSVRMLVDGFESNQGVVSYLRDLTRYDGSASVITREPGSGNFRAKPVVWEVRDGVPVVRATGRTRPVPIQPPTDSDDPRGSGTVSVEPENPHD